MAGLDKVTTMRRLIIAAKESAHVIYEGVDIEGTALLKETFSDVTITVMPFERLVAWVNDHNADNALRGYEKQDWKLWVLDPDERVDVRDLRDKEASGGPDGN